MSNTTVPREVVRITMEQQTLSNGQPGFGVFDTTATIANGRQTFVALTGDNAMTVRRTPNFSDRVSAGATNTRVRRDARTYNVAGKLTTPAIPSVTPLIMALLINKTTGTCPDLPSFSIDHCFFLENGCLAVQSQYLGCKFASGTIAASAESEEVMLDLDIVGSQYVNTLPNPSATPPYAGVVITDYNDIPDFLEGFGFIDSAGGLVWGGDGASSPVIRTRYSSFGLEVKNNLATFRGETPYLQDINLRGRTATLTIANVYRSAQDRIDYNTAAAKASRLTLNFGGLPNNGQASLDFNLGGRNYIGSVNDDLKMGGKYMQTVSFDNFIDPNTGTDLIVTYTAPTSTSS